MLLGEGFEVGIEEAGTAGLGLGGFTTLVLLGLHATGYSVDVGTGLDGFTGLVHSARLIYIQGLASSLQRQVPPHTRSKY